MSLYLGVGHGDDLVLEFPLVETYLPHLQQQPIIKADTEDEQFSKNFIRLLTSFAIHGYVYIVKFVYLGIFEVNFNSTTATIFLN